MRILHMSVAEGGSGGPSGQENNSTATQGTNTGTGGGDNASTTTTPAAAAVAQGGLAARSSNGSQTNNTRSGQSPHPGGPGPSLRTNSVAGPGAGDSHISASESSSIASSGRDVDSSLHTTDLSRSASAGGMHVFGHVMVREESRDT